MAKQGNGRPPPHAQARVQVRPFANEVLQMEARLPELELTPLASVSFPIRSWQLSESHPRAIFHGDGQVVVFDTDASPWKELLRLKDDQIQADSVFMLGADAACFSQSRAAGRLPALWQLKWGGTAPAPALLRECPQIALSRAPFRLETSPDAGSLVYLSENEPDLLEVTWLDSAFQPRTAKVERVQEPAAKKDRKERPFVAWWPAGGQEIVIEDNGTLFHLAHTSDDLRLVKATPGQATLSSIPQGATPGQFLTPARWGLRGDNILMEMDPRSGMPRQAFKLPSRFIGKPMGWIRRHQSVLLQNHDHDLVMVQPQHAR